MAPDILASAMITSKITSKGQTTLPIPQPVRSALRVREGDELAYRIRGDHVVLTRQSGNRSTIRSPLSMSGPPRPTGAPMAIFEVWDSVKVRFPYTDRPVRQRRPALVVVAGEIQATHRLLWLVMITRAENRGWPDDVGKSDLRAAGLPAPSIVRPAKIATVDAADAQRLGTLPHADREAVASCLRGILSAAAEISQGK
jgi:mRNA interferase MazF